MPRKRKVREIVEESRQLPCDERAELIELLIAATVGTPTRRSKWPGRRSAPPHQGN